MQSLFKKLTSNHLLKRSHNENNKNENELIISNKNNIFNNRKRNALADISNTSAKIYCNKNEGILKRRNTKTLLPKEPQRTKLKSKLHLSLNQIRQENYTNKKLNYQNTDNNENLNYMNRNDTFSPQNNVLNFTHNNSSNDLQNQQFENKNFIDKENKYIFKKKEITNGTTNNKNLLKNYNNIYGYCVNTTNLSIKNEMSSNNISDVNNMNSVNNVKNMDNMNRINRMNNTIIPKQNQSYSIVNDDNINKYISKENDQKQLNQSISMEIKKGVKRSRPSFSPDGKFSVTNKTLFSPKVKKHYTQPKDINKKLLSTNSSNQFYSNPCFFNISNVNSKLTEQNSNHNELRKSGSLVNILSEINTNVNLNNSNSNINDKQDNNLKRKRSCSSIHSIAVELKKRHSLKNFENYNKKDSFGNQDTHNEIINNIITNNQIIFDEKLQKHKSNSIYNNKNNNDNDNSNNNNSNSINSINSINITNNINNVNNVSNISNHINYSNIFINNKHNIKSEWNQEKNLNKLKKTQSENLIKNVKRRHDNAPPDLSQSTINNYYPKLQNSSSLISNNKHSSKLFKSSNLNSSLKNRYNFIKNKTITPLQKENSTLTLINNSMSMQQIPNSQITTTATQNSINNRKILESINLKTNLVANFENEKNNIKDFTHPHLHHQNSHHKYSHLHPHSHRKNNSSLLDNINSCSKNQENSILNNDTINESYQKSNSVISSTSTLVNSFSFSGSAQRSSESILNTSEREKSFMKYLETNTKTNIPLSENKIKNKTKKEITYDPISLSEYSSDIYNYMKELEVKMLPDPNYVEHQQEVTWNSRTILINWIAEVHWKFRMQPETLFLTVNIIDRFLSVKSIKLNKFQLLGICSLLISAKYEETLVPSIKDLVFIVNNIYTNEEIIQAERCVLVLLGFDLGFPGPMYFLRRISKADGYDTKTRTLAKYLIEITLLDEHFISCPPSLIASAAVLLARKILFNNQNWNKLFIYYSGYNENLLIPVAQNIINYALPKAEHHQLPFIKKKYSIDSFKKVSLFVSQWIKKQCLIEENNKEQNKITPQN